MPCSLLRSWGMWRKRGGGALSSPNAQRHSAGRLQGPESLAPTSARVTEGEGGLERGGGPNMPHGCPHGNRQARVPPELITILFTRGKPPVGPGMWALLLLHLAGEEIEA